MAKKHLRNDSHHIRGRDDIWWYEENGGICVVWQAQRHTSAQMATIPWAVLRRALERKDKP